MTPKEKAMDLYNKFRNQSNVLEANYKSKKNALIAIEEIIKESKLHDLTIYQHERTAYLNSVKLEIEKL